MMNIDLYISKAQAMGQTMLGWLQSPQFYAQAACIILAWFLSKYMAAALRNRIPFLNQEPTEGRLLRLRTTIYSCRDLVRPITLFITLSLAAMFCDGTVATSWLVRIAQSLAIVSLLYALINRFVRHPLANAAARWVGIPLAAAFVFGYMPQVLGFLDRAAFEAGNIRISLLALAKAVIFGGLLFWAGRLSSTTGQRVIRQQESIDVQTRELAAKAFDLVVMCVGGLLLLNLLGMDMGVLAVFSGAVGVGLGFGLQQIASNFISGIIILIDRSINLGDYIELDDGKAGNLTAINMRSSTLETYDGKEIMVPNDRFITTRFINWTKGDPRQRYQVNFTVGPATDLRKIPPLIEKAMSGVKGVLNKPQKPECVFKEFGTGGYVFSARFWVLGVDDGQNTYSSDVLFSIWEALKAAEIEIVH